MARTNGCPMKISDWTVEIEGLTSTELNPVWVPIKGVNSITYSLSGETADGSGADSLWKENYVSKRSVTLSLEALPKYDGVTGVQDAGQELLDHYAMIGGCDADARIRLADPYGHAEILTVIVTSTGKNASDTDSTRSWDMDVVGEPELLQYVQLTAIATSPASTASVAVNDTEDVTVTFTPSTASNKKFTVGSADTSKVKITDITATGFTLRGVAVTSSAVNVVVKSMNNNLTATLAVTVTAT